ncbi:MAG: hypothetical protein N3A67_07365 [Ignavibacteria bacterium]|nr:hypothetical protein [Ignavibacteria bacterium]
MNEALLKAGFILTSAFIFVLINSDIVVKVSTYIKKQIVGNQKK